MSIIEQLYEPMVSCHGLMFSILLYKCKVIMLLLLLVL